MAEKLCPLMHRHVGDLTGGRTEMAPCVEHGCRWYIQILGVNPQTGEQMSKWGCAVEWLPVLMIENSQQQRQTGAAVESFRNESVKNARALTAGLIEAANAAMQGRPPELKDITSTRSATLEHKGE